MRSLILFLAMAGGVAAAIGGPLLGLALGLVGWMGQGRTPGNLLVVATAALAVSLLGLGFGLTLAWTGWSAMRAQPVRPFRLPRWGWWLLVLAGVMAGGQAAFSAGVTALMPIFHIAAGALPAFLFLSMALGSARRRGAGIMTRPATGSIAWGGLGGAGLAIVLEVILVLAVMVAAALWLSATNPDLIQRLQTWALKVQQTGNLQDLTDLTPLLTSPIVALAIMGLIGLLIPLIEEAAKSLAVPLVALTGRHLTRLDGFLLGVASGAGFALLEGILNGALALSTPPEGWAGLMLIRGCTAAIHCCASGLTGLGWQAMLVERRWARGIGLWLLAVVLHGAWNSLSGVQSLLALRAAVQTGAARPVSGLLLVLPFLLLLGVIWLVVVLALALLPARLVGGEGASS